MGVAAHSLVLDLFGRQEEGRDNTYNRVLDSQGLSGDGDSVVVRCTLDMQTDGQR